MIVIPRWIELEAFNEASHNAYAPSERIAYRVSINVNTVESIVPMGAPFADCVMLVFTSGKYIALNMEYEAVRSAIVGKQLVGDILS